MSPILPRAAGAILTVDLDAIAANYRSLRERARPARAAAVVKADGYGVGAVPVARRLAEEGCTEFFVAHLSEAVALRAALPLPVIYVLNGLYKHCEADFAAHDVVPVLSDRGMVERWSAWCRAHGARPAAIQFDTGMTRLGLEPRDAEWLAGDPHRLAAFADVLVMSHLARSEEDVPMNAAQLARFRPIRQRLARHRASFANSSGIFLGPDYHFDQVRPGYALYGGNPTPGRPNPMRAALSLAARIVQVRETDSPRSVGYNATAQVPAGSRIATISVGYADGYLRAFSNKGRARIAGHAAPVIGRVSMDLVTLDVSAVPPGLAEPGAFAHLIDDELTVDALADIAGTNGYEILTSLGPRYHRVYRSAPT